jgi:acyl carrier protein
MTLDSFEADSLDYVEFLFEVDDKFDVDIDNDKLNDSSLTLKQLIDLITTQVSVSLKEKKAQES